MAIQGELRDFSLPALVQFVMHESAAARVTVHRGAETAHLFLADNQLQHAVLQNGTDDNNIHSGEEVVYEILAWQDGLFTVDMDVLPPTQSIKQSWDYLLMEGLRRLDEAGQPPPTADDVPTEDLQDVFSELSSTDTAVITEIMARYKENDDMATKSEQLRSILNNTVNNSTDLTGAAVVDNDGLLLSSVLSGDLDQNRVAAVSAGLVSLASRSAQQLRQGDISQIVIRAENGNIIAMRAGEKASLVALTGTNVNLGMVFLECSDAANEIKMVL